MKRIRLVALLMIAISLLSFNFVNAQNEERDFYNYKYKERNSGSFDKNTNLINLGFGFPNQLRYNSGAGFGPLYVKYEHGILDEIGIGGELGFATARTSRNFIHQAYRRSGFNLGISGFYHFNKFIPVKRLDVYVGLGVGAQIISYSNDFGMQDQSADASPVFISKAGARWYFTPGFAAYLEAGYDNLSYLNLGVTLRF